MENEMYDVKLTLYTVEQYYVTSTSLAKWMNYVTVGLSQSLGSPDFDGSCHPASFSAGDVHIIRHLANSASFPVLPISLLQSPSSSPSL